MAGRGMARHLRLQKAGLKKTSSGRLVKVADVQRRVIAERGQERRVQVATQAKRETVSVFDQLMDKRAGLERDLAQYNKRLRELTSGSQLTRSEKMELSMLRQRIQLWNSFVEDVDRSIARTQGKLRDMKRERDY